MEAELLEMINIMRINSGKPAIDKIDPNLSLRKEIGFDSLDLAEFTVRIEDKYGIDIFEEGNIDTISEVLDKIKK